MRLKQIRQVIEWIERSNFKFNDFERDFMQSMRRLMDKQELPTPKQLIALMNIYRDKTGGGTYQKRQYI